MENNDIQDSPYSIEQQNSVITLNNDKSPNELPSDKLENLADPKEGSNEINKSGEHGRSGSGSSNSENEESNYVNQ